MTGLPSWQGAKSTLTLACLILLADLTSAQNPKPTSPVRAPFPESPPEQTLNATTVRAREVADLRWGLYLCWSFCCFSGKQWTPNVKDISLFSATRCDTDQWARTAREAGMGYICFLTKHHDGFCLWDTDTSERKVTRTQLGLDVLASLRKSCKKYGLKLALYFSESEWRWPGAREGQAYYNGINPQVKKAQLAELLTRYGPIEFIWLDNAVGDGGLNHLQTTEWVKRFQPNCFVGFSSGQPAGEMQIGEDGRPGPMDHHAVVCPYMDNNPFDKWDPTYRGYRITEILQPIIAEPAPMWFYDPSAGDTCRSAEDLHATYLGAVKHGNLFNLGVSPDRQGKLRDIEVRTLQQVGKLIRDPQTRPFSLSTHKPARTSSVLRAEYDAAKAVDNDDTSSWTAAPGATNGWLEVDLGREENIGAVEIRERFSFPCYPIKRFSIEYKNGAEWKIAAQGTTIGISKTIVFPPVAARHIRLNILDAAPINGLLVIEEFRLWPPHDPQIRLPVSARVGVMVSVSAEWAGRPEMVKAHVNDGDFNTIWGGPENSRSGWVQLDLGEEREINGALLDEGNFFRVFRFQLQAQVKGNWKRLVTGTTIGRNRHMAFKPIRARVFRVVILESTDVPVLSEFQLSEQN